MNDIFEDRYMTSKIKDIKDALYKWGDEHKDTVRMISVGLDPYDEEYIRVMYSIPTSDIWDGKLPTREIKYVKAIASFGVPVYRIVAYSIYSIEKTLKERGLIDKSEESINRYYVMTLNIYRCLSVIRKHVLPEFEGLSFSDYQATQKEIGFQFNYKDKTKFIKIGYFDKPLWKFKKDAYDAVQEFVEKVNADVNRYKYLESAFDTINKEENTMNVKYMIKVMIDSNRVGKYSDGSYNKAVLDADLRRLLIHYETERDEYINHYKKCEPTKIIYNGPATIVFFKDGDKVVVKRQEGDYNDREKAVAMAIMKKTLGTNEKKTNYLDNVKKLMREAGKEERKQQVAKSKELIDKARAELSGRMEFTKFQAAGWLAWFDTCKSKHIGPGCEKAIATEMGYETITKFRKAKEAAQVKGNEE